MTKYVDEVLNEKLIGLNGENINFNKVDAASCASQYNTAKARCQRDLNLHGTFAIIGCIGGPWACAGGLLLAGAEHTNCMADAKEDYKACLKN